MNNPIWNFVVAPYRGKSRYAKWQQFCNDAAILFCGLIGFGLLFVVACW